MTTNSASNVRRLALLSGLDDDEIRAVAPYFQQRQFAAGEVVREAGEPMDSVLIPVRGRIEILTADSMRPVATVEPGDMLGLDCLLSEGPQPMFCRAASDSIVLELKRHDFLEIANAPGTLGLRVIHQVLKHLARQLRHVDEVLDAWATPPEPARPQPTQAAEGPLVKPPPVEPLEPEPDPKARKRKKRKVTETDEQLLDRIRQYSEKAGLGDLDTVRVSRSGDQMIKPPGYDSVRRR